MEPHLIQCTLSAGFSATYDLFWATNHDYISHIYVILSHVLSDGFVMVCFFRSCEASLTSAVCRVALLHAILFAFFQQGVQFLHGHVLIAQMQGGRVESTWPLAKLSGFSDLGNEVSTSHAFDVFGIGVVAYSNFRPHTSP